MKIYMVLLLATYGALAKKLALSDILDSWKPTVEPFQSECLCKSGASQQHLQLFFKHGVISDNPCFKCMAKCVAFKQNIMSLTGEIDAQRLVDLFPHTNLHLVKKCVDNLQELDLCQKMYLAGSCIFKAVAEQCK